MQRKWFSILSLILILILAIPTTDAKPTIAQGLVERPADGHGVPRQTLTVSPDPHGDALGSQRSPSTTGQSTLLSEAVRLGAFPAQLIGHDGTIQPNRYGPQRNDPTEGIPDHTYSPYDERRNREYPCPPGGCEFATGHVIVKVASHIAVRSPDRVGAWTESDSLNAALNAQGILDLTPIFASARPPRPGEMIVSPTGEQLPKPDLTRWYRARLAREADVYAVVDALGTDPGVEYAEPDYFRRPVGDPAERSYPHPNAGPLSLPGPGTDPLYAQQWHLGAANISQAWQWLEDNGYEPGGSRDVVVAVVDTGVDYTHPDLAANMWVNAAEFNGSPGVDDDGNGYVDDIYGADTVYPDGDPQDDHGHGTHVAGIIAAQANNGEGGVGVAYNVQLMALKAAQYSGVLASSDIAEAIYYAVEKGADVINMSFGGYARSQVEEDALAVAFGQAVLVAAAGNDGKVNLPCPLGRDMYPAAYNWVLGVMASTSGGSRASFSNYDCEPHDSHEYELLAPGVDVWSTLPNGQYAAWDGTSMSAPVVSGIAALLRTRWDDKDVYSSRFIMGQIASNASPVADAYTALTVAPQPELSYLEHWLFDTEAQSSFNDDDGIVDAGETVDLAIVIRNHWGKADPVTVTLEAWAEGAVYPDPYVTMITDTVSYGAIGSFNQDDNGLIYDAEGVIVGVRHPFRFTTPITTPNDHVIPFRLIMTCRNGLEPIDTTTYTFESRFYLIVQRGHELPRIIDEDMTLTKDYYWLVTDQILIEEGVTVTVEPGTQIQFWAGDPQDPLSQDRNAAIQVEGILDVEGTAEEPVEMFPGQLRPNWTVGIIGTSVGSTRLVYAKITNPFIGWYFPWWNYPDKAATLIDHCYFNQSSDTLIVLYPETGNVMNVPPMVRSDLISNSIFYKLGVSGWSTPGEYNALQVDDEVSTALYDSCIIFSEENNAVSDSVFLKNHRIFNTYETYICASRIDAAGFACTDCTEEVGRNSNRFRHNAILNLWYDPDISRWMRFYSWSQYSSSYGREWTYYLNDNYWATTSTELIDAAIHDFNDDFNKPKIDYAPILTTPVTTIYPFAVDVTLSTVSYSDMSALRGPTPIVGAEMVTFTVTFNRDMNTTVQPAISFGPDVPETDYTIHPLDGGWQDPRTWGGTFNITPITGDGYQLMRIAGAVATDDPWLVTGDDSERFRFEIITSGTEAMNLQATGGEGYVDLSWTQDDFDLLSGFHLYRSTTISGDYARINASIIPPDVHTYRNTDVQPGQPYYYKFTVVKSDMTESDFSNIAEGTPVDTILPAISHTPVAEAPPGLPLTLYADVTDNVSVQAVTLYFRHIGGTPYTSRAMVHTTGDRYAATVEGSLMTSPGIEYYIEADDGVNTAREGRADYPYQVTVEDRPVVTTISPGAGPTEGGTSVTISGSNFKAGASVTFGGAVAGNVAVLSSNQITCTSPSHFPETVDVTVINPDAQSGTLLRAFAYQSSAAQLGLPDTGGRQNAIVQVPISAVNVQGLAAADLTVTFDASVLDAQGAATGNLTPGWSLEANTSTPGQAHLAMASSGGTVSGSGTLATLEFQVLGSPSMTSTLHFAAVSLNDGAISAEVVDGSFVVSLVYDVAGAVRFWYNSVGISGTLLSLVGDRVYTDISDTAGDYLITGVPTDSYTLTPSKSDGVNGISAYDASLALQHAADLATLSGHQATAADVNKSGSISSMDAFYILQKAVDLIALPFPGAGLVWDFDPASRALPNLSTDYDDQDFTGILLGEVSGNWSGAGLLRRSASAADPVTLRVQGGIPDGAGVVTATLIVESGSASVQSLDLALSYDPDVVTALAATTGPEAQEWMMSANLSQPGEIKVALAGALPVSGDAQVLLLTFQLDDASGTGTEVALTRGDVNEGQIPTNLLPGWLGARRIYLPLALRQF